LQAINESVPGLSATPPWDFRLRPRGGLKEDGKTMMQWRGAPWKDPQILDSSGRLNSTGPPEFFTRYMRLTKLDRPPAASLASMAGLSGTNFVQCEANPGVALDNSNHKYRILMIQDGQAKTVGRFHVEKEGIEGYNAYNDMQTKGPLGICGVPNSVGNIGPPGVALLPKAEWHRNRRNRPPIDEGNYDEYAKKENAFALRRFSEQRTGNENARLEKELAVDVLNSRGRHAAVAEIRNSLGGVGPTDSKAKTSKLHVYDDRGLTLTSMKGAPLTDRPSAGASCAPPAINATPMISFATFCCTWDPCLQEFALRLQED
jgi:hypothetical protein